MNVTEIKGIFHCDCGFSWAKGESGGHDCADGLREKLRQLAAENVALKAVFSQEEIPSEAVDAFMETAVMDHDWNETSEWSWVENETEVIHAVLDALKPDTPATDRIVAGIKADAIDEAAVELDRVDTVASTRVIGFKLREFAKQLREGDGK
ncbi:dynein light chain family protein [Klebsiella pneumoniae]